MVIAQENPLTMNTEKIILGGGCFWCVEAVFQRVEGVKAAVSGYMGGKVDNPTYREICNGTTGHAEVVEIEFDPSIVSLEDLLDLFWRAHDPTTLNRQGADVGTQYRSVIFYHDDEQNKVAEESKASAQANFDDPIVTQISAATKFYKAEDYHQDYYDQNKNAGYCRVVIAPKLNKLKLKD
ncbi:MAG: peptide-methionine (S)-S-oxide reductase MsrA [Verrucomicrobiota bacterium]